MIKELWTLTKMLFATKPSEIEEVKLMGMEHFPFKGYSYMMWCGRMVYRKDMYDTRRKEWITKKYKVSKNHETIHLMQAKQCGSWTKYYLRYLWEWLKPGFMAPLKANYYTIPYEMEAYANEEKFDYPEGMIVCSDNYSEGICEKYVIKNGRKVTFKEVGGTPQAWKAYLKTL